MTALDPKLLGFWTKCIRHTSHLSQEALAACSGLDVRTVQRIEAGKAVSVTTRRALARGLGYDDPGVFDKPEFIRDVTQLLSDIDRRHEEEFRSQYPEHITVRAELVTGASQIGRIAECNGYLFHADDDLSQDVQSAAASLFDYVHDLGDVFDEVSFADRVRFCEEINSMLADLQSMGANLYSATRSTKIVGANWVDKTPMPFTIGYLTVVPRDKAIKEIIVPRRLS